VCDVVAYDGRPYRTGAALIISRKSASISH
jgi:hypothetical protein